MFFQMLFFCLSAVLTGCTYSINMVHTQGDAKDVVDEQQAADPNINPNVSLTPK